MIRERRGEKTGERGGKGGEEREGRKERKGGREGMGRKEGEEREDRKGRGGPNLTVMTSLWSIR